MAGLAPHWHAHRRPARRAVAVAACAAAALAAGCSAASGTGGQDAQQAVMAAARRFAAVTSLTGTFSEQASGTAAVVASGTIRERLKPDPVLTMSLNSALSGDHAAIGIVVTGKDVYVRVSALAGLVGRPWIEVPLSSVGGGSDLSRLFRSVTLTDPSAQAGLLGGVRKARRVGAAVVDGVPTTEYAGSATASAALATLSPAARRRLAPELKDISGRTTVRVWVDAGGLVRKIVETASADGEKITTTIILSRFDKPVRVSVPPASQVRSLDLGSLHPGSLSL